MSALRIVFMGTPEFAVTILDKLVQENLEVVGVVTAPDKPAGRGRKIQESDVKQYAVANNLNILQPSNLKAPEFVAELEALQADVFVVVAFRMLPEVVWGMPAKGTINLHASLLPNYRGAAPINWAIINGEVETGVTTFFIEKEIDTGKIIQQEKVQIGADETVGELYMRLMHLGANVMYNTLTILAEGTVASVAQEQLMKESDRSAPKIFKDDCKINFAAPMDEVHDFCRGLSPYPAAWCTLLNTEKDETKTYKLFGTKKTDQAAVETKRIKAVPEGILFPCADHYLLVTEIQPEGKRKMHYKEFLAGNSVDNLVISED